MTNLNAALKLTTREGNEIHRFESVHAMNSYIDKTTADRVLKNNGSFIGREFKSLAQLEDSLKEAWLEGMATVNMFIKRLAEIEFPAIKAVKAKKTYGTEGDELDFDRMMSGNPECYMTVEREKRGPSSVTIVIDTTTAAHRNSSDILWRGAAALALTHLLESQGYSVELWMVNGSRLYMNHSGRGIMTAVCLKRTSDPLDMATLVAAVSGWFYRTETFMLLETVCLRNNQPVAYGYGRCHCPTPADLDTMTTDQKRMYVSEVFTFDGACNLIQAELQRIANEE